MTQADGRIPPASRANKGRSTPTGSPPQKPFQACGYLAFAPFMYRVI